MCKHTVNKLLSFVDRPTSSSTIDKNQRAATHQVWTLLIDGGLERGERLVSRLERARQVPGVISPDLVCHGSISLAARFVAGVAERNV